MNRLRYLSIEVPIVIMNTSAYVRAIKETATNNKYATL